MSSSAFEVPDDGKFDDGRIDQDRFIRAMVRLARSSNDAKSIRLLLSSIRISQERNRGAGDNDDGNRHVNRLDIRDANEFYKKTHDASQTSTNKRHSDEERRNAGIKRARMTDADEHADKGTYLIDEKAAQEQRFYLNKEHKNSGDILSQSDSMEIEE